VALIVFSHANSYPASTYRVLFEALRAQGHTVEAIDRFGHDPAYPVTDNWPHLLRQLADFAGQAATRHGAAPFLVGHSLGGFLSLMTAARHPRLGGQAVRGVLLLDSPIVAGWRAWLLAAAKRTRLAHRVPPASIAQQRRHRWPGAADAHAHFSSKALFARWEPAVLRDYIDHGTVDVETGQRALHFQREVEASIYRTLPHNLPTLLRRHPPQCPVAFVGGRQSTELRQVGLAMTQRVTQGRITLVEGTHLFPMERPAATADEIDRQLAALTALPQP
jgi:pimeloyl-ACP methyl ester carboxylesterase